jgi:hypothetical protein
VALVAGGDGGNEVRPPASQPSPDSPASNLPSSIDHSIDQLEQLTR